MTQEADERKASDADRSLAMVALREAAAAGVFGIDELQVRLDAVIRAETVGELATITWEARLPVPAPGSAPGTGLAVGSAAEPRGGMLGRWSRWRQNTGFRIHSTVYLLVNGFLVGTWGLTGHGFFWPFFPAAGWGIGVGIHAAAISHKTSRPGDGKDPDYDWVRIDGNWVRVPVGRGAELVLEARGESGDDRADRVVEKPGRDRGRGGPAVRYVVVMFADVANSTALNEAMGDQAWSRLRARHLGMLRECIGTHDGTEVSTQGDGIFARFDHPMDAVGCAVEIQRRIEHQLEESGFAPRVRVGIHAGEAVEEESDLIGNMVNLAARVAAVADAAEICITEPVADKAGDRFRLEDRGLHTLKGVARPRHLLTVRW